MLNFPFSAALIAGGQSRRMGEDKAGLIVGGELLWRRQLAVLRELNPTQVFICGRRGVTYPDAECDVILDVVPDSGPLGGLVTALRHTSTEVLVVLAVDMPMMQSWFLTELLCREAAKLRSIIPQTPETLEPLAAVYRKESLAIAEACLRSGERSMRTFIDKLRQRELAESVLLTERELPLFRNVNTPEDLTMLKQLLRGGG